MREETGTARFALEPSLSTQGKDERDKQSGQEGREWIIL
jgi:hypothetical protein